MTDPAIVGDLLGKAGLDSEAGLAQVQEAEVKERIKRNTAQAIADGTFGVLTVVVDGELFWGHDDFHFLDKFLGGLAGYREEDMAAWENVEASIKRRR